jgi:hypothetical protein
MRQPQPGVFQEQRQLLREEVTHLVRLRSLDHRPGLAHVPHLVAHLGDLME